MHSILDEIASKPCYIMGDMINTSRTQRYIEKIRTTDWSILESYNECQTYFSNFLKMFKNIYDECFPMTKVKYNIETVYHG